jgi:hypothetical protein
MTSRRPSRVVEVTDEAGMVIPEVATLFVVAVNAQPDARFDVVKAVALREIFVSSKSPFGKFTRFGLSRRPGSL